MLDKKLFIKVSLVRCLRLVIFYFKEKFCVSHASASLLWDVYCLQLFEDLVKKVISPVIIDTNHSVKCFFFKWMFFKVSMAHRSPLVTFYFKEKFRAFRTRWQVACEMFISKAFLRPRRKNYISVSIWHKSFIKDCLSKFLEYKHYQ